MSVIKKLACGGLDTTSRSLQFLTKHSRTIFFSIVFQNYLQLDQKAAMGKKGKKGGGKKGRKSKKDGLNPREAFLKIRLKMRRKHLAEAKAELESLTGKLVK